MMSAYEYNEYMVSRRERSTISSSVGGGAWDSFHRLDSVGDDSQVLRRLACGAARGEMVVHLALLHQYARRS